MGPYFMQASPKFPREQKGERYDLDFPPAGLFIKYSTSAIQCMHKGEIGRTKRKEINIQAWSVSFD
jgi:hypothetical protein